MRLLHIIPTVDPAWGGPVEALARQARATLGLATREVVTLDAPYAPFLADFPMPVHALGARRTRLRPFAGWGYTPDFAPWLRANLHRFDAAVVEGLWTYASFGAGRVLPASRLPYVVFAHGMLDPWFRRAKPLKHWVKQASWALGEGPLVHGARALLFTAEEERLRARAAFLGWRYSERVVDFGAGAPPPTTAADRDLFHAAAPRLGHRPYLLFLGRVHPKKGCDLLIEAFARISAARPDLDLVLAGPDADGWTSEILRRADRLGVRDRLHVTGPLYGPAKWGALRGAEAFVLTSHQENFGVAVAEALACGVPVLISDKVNIWREIDAAGAGLIGPDTVDGAADLLRRWNALPASARDAMRDRAAALFHRRFDVARTAPALLDMVRHLCAPQAEPLADGDVVSHEPHRD